ncbi:MAG: trimethylamine methyltransferase family protein [Acidimicrobiia bacterium]|nr:trimethylamine methyltransferase family protein [Acidimicrobiia bacterium]
MTDAAKTRRRRGARRREGRAGGGNGYGLTPVEQPPATQPKRSMAPAELLSADQIEALHQASVTVLRNTGMDVLNAQARRLLAAAGATVSGERVRFDPEMIDDYMASAPPEFALHARNPERSLRIGGPWVAFSAVASAPNVSDVAGGRRTGNRVDHANLVRLAQVLNTVHLLGGYPVEPTDIHASVRHLHATHDQLVLSDKPIHAYSLGAQRNRDCLEMVRIARGVSHEQLEAEPSIISIINTSSPLRLDDPMAQGIIEYSSRNQLIVVTPFTLAGAMAPVTLAGALVQQNAEALAGIVFTQVVRRGAPVMYGGFTSNVDMKSGSPAFGTPEYLKAAIVGGQLARRYSVPYRSSNVNAGNALDAQSAYESVFSLWGAITGGANLVKHAAGWMEGGLVASYEKMVLDADLLGMVSEFLRPIDLDPEALAVAAIDEVGPGGHFFGIEHTQDRFRTAFFHPMLSDWRNHESWVEAGSPTTDKKMSELVERLLAEHVDPPMDPDRRAELDEFVARRVAEGGVATDY